MPKENNKLQVDIENLFKQNVNDLSSIKELYRKLEELQEKISQIKYIDSNLANKLKKEYERLKKIILDENVQAKLTNDIETINSQMDNTANKINSYIYLSDFIEGNETDFSVPLQNVIDYAKEHKKQIILGSGTFKFSQTLNMYNYINIKGCGNNKTVLEYTGESIAFNCIDTTNVYDETWNYGCYGLYINDLTIKGTNKSGTCIKGELRYCNFNNLTIRNFDTLIDITNDWTINFTNCDFRESNIILKLDKQNNAINFTNCKANSSNYLIYGLQCYNLNWSGGNIEGIKKCIIGSSNPTWNRLNSINIVNCYLENECPLIDLTDIESLQLTGFELKNCIINVKTNNYFIDCGTLTNVFWNSLIENNIFYNLTGDYTLFNLNSCRLSMKNNTYYYFSNGNNINITTPFTNKSYNVSGVEIITNLASGSINSNFIGSKKGIILATTNPTISKPDYMMNYDAELNILKIYENNVTHCFQEIKSGTTSERPTSYISKKGFMYFDTDLGKPIWLKQRDNGVNKWVDSTGVSV